MALSAGRTPQSRLYPRARRAYIAWGTVLYLLGCILAVELSQILEPRPLEVFPNGRLTGQREHHRGLVDLVSHAWSTTAVPMAKNSITCEPQPWLRSTMRAPTIPSARSSSASPCMRSIASSRASYRAWV